MARFLVLLMISVLVLTNQVTGKLFITQSEFEAFKLNVEERLQITEKELLDTTTDLHNTKLRLYNAETDLQTTKQELQTTKQELQTTKLRLDNAVGSKDLLSDFDEDNKIESRVGVVAFSVHRDNNDYQGGSVIAPIPFEVIDYVIGTGYDTVTSVFTAPVGGLYFFAASFIDNNSVMQAYITISGVLWRYANSDNGFDTVSMSGVAQLQAGDTVSVDLEANQWINCETENNACHFDGFLLYEQL